MGKAARGTPTPASPCVSLRWASQVLGVKADPRSVCRGPRIWWRAVSAFPGGCFVTSEMLPTASLGCDLAGAGKALQRELPVACLPRAAPVTARPPAPLPCPPSALSS